LGADSQRVIMRIKFLTVYTFSEVIKNRRVI
jgi:hypothetical protein